MMGQARPGAAGARRAVTRVLFGTAAKGRFHKLSVRIWDNWARLDHNLVHAAHHALCRSRYLLTAGSRRVTPESVEAARFVLRDGICVIRDALDPDLVQRVAARSRELLADPRSTWSPEGLESFSTHVTDSARLAPEMFRFLTPHVVSVVENVFRSHFKIYYTEIYRTHPTTEAAKMSWLWHSDNHPGAILKIMVHLNDVSAETGAIRVLPWRVTRPIYERGYRDRYRTDAFERELNDPASQVVAEGRAGTVIVFDNNLIHKATAPQHGHRDVAVFEVIPSLVPWDAHLPGAISRVGRNQGYPANPFRV